MDYVSIISIFLQIVTGMLDLHVEHLVNMRAWEGMNFADELAQGSKFFGMF